MMDKDERKQLYTVLEKRILAGESKSKIYAEYHDDKDSQLVTRLLAQIPTSARRKQFSLLNQILLAAVGIVTAVNLIIFALFALPEMPKEAMFLLIIAIWINGYLIWAIAKFRRIGYLLVIGFGFKVLSNLMKYYEEGMPPIVFAFEFICITATIVFTLVLMKKLFPQTSCLFFQKKDKSGNPIFED